MAVAWAIEPMILSRKIKSAFKYKVHYVFNFQTQNQNLPFLCIFFSHSDSYYNAPFIPQPVILSYPLCPFITPMIFLFEIPQSYMGETVFVMQQTELGAGAEDDVGGKALWQPSQGHLLENLIPNSLVRLLTPSPLLPFQPPDLNLVCTTEEFWMCTKTPLMCQCTLSANLQWAQKYVYIYSISCTGWHFLYYFG